MAELKHEAVSASAGSGKTYRLAHRYIRLLADGVQPDRISALTFSRKAAGEIFDAIVEHLVKAAASDEAARAKARELGRRRLAPQSFVSLLRLLTDNLHRMHIGTLDSFVVGVVRAFPAELGVPPDFQVLDNDGADAVALSRDVLARILTPATPGRGERRTFHEAFKQATFGSEEKDIEARLDEFIGALRTIYRHVPREEAWGMERAIWPEQSKCPVAPGRKAGTGVDKAAKTVRDWLDTAALPGNFINSVLRFVDFAAAYGETSRWDPGALTGTGLLALLDAAGPGLRKPVTVTYSRRDYEIDAAVCRAVHVLFRHVVAVETGRAIRQTRGLFRVLDEYNGFYREVATRTGRLTFEDLHYLMTCSDEQRSALLPSRTPGREDRLYIDYRLDCRLDHWLLDEFQDTSDLQWDALRNLADEILQDSSGRRSFFYVGDVKQAIYGWRGGNPRLFTGILHSYAGRIDLEHLAASYRSAQPIIDTVNTVFGDLEDGLLPGGTVKEWNELWKEHRCAEKVPASGYTAMFEALPAPGERRVTNEDRYLLTAAILRETDPLPRGLDAAVLVRSNDAGRAVVETLRRECPGMPVVHEGTASIKDDPSVVLLLSLVALAGHPADTYARRVVEMSPLDVVSDGSLSQSLLQEIHRHGFREFVRRRADELDAAGALTDFARARLDDLAAAAGEFDAGGSRDGDEFIEFVENYEVRDPPARGAIRVMTIHQSKGLGFDMVILPELMGGNMAKAREIGTVSGGHGEDGLPAWVLKMPRRMIAEQDGVLAAKVRECDEQACFEELCVLYVAMTRAKQGLYMICGSQGKGASSCPPSAFLKSRLLGDPRAGGGVPVNTGGVEAILLHEHGDSDWIDSAAAEAPPAVPPLRDLDASFVKRPSQRRKLVHIEPSSREETVTRLSWVFDAESRAVLDFGSAIHALFERVEWIEDADAETIVEQWLAESGAIADDVRHDACTQFRQALANGDVRSELARPAPDAELWREKSFEVILDGALVSGAFDRVTIVRNAKGRLAHATVLDYKSNRIAGESEFAEAVQRYAPQLDLYRRALARILDAPLPRIRARILFTRAARIFDVA